MSIVQRSRRHLSAQVFEFVRQQAPWALNTYTYTTGMWSFTLLDVLRWYLHSHRCMWYLWPLQRSRGPVSSDA